MATATSESSGVKFVLELNEQEAQYVESALRKSVPTELVGDPVWDALEEAMVAAGVGFNAAAS